VVERFLPSPAGGTEGLLLREGPQLLFPADSGEAISSQIAPGQKILAWGIRARTVPVITMLAWSREENEEPRIVERPRFIWNSVRGGEARPMRVEGEVRRPLHNARGEVIGALLEDGTVVQGSADAVAAAADRFKPKARIAVAGFGVEGPHGRAIEIERVAETEAELQAPPPASGPAASAPAR
jgi:hypothetical protein